MASWKKDLDPAQFSTIIEKSRILGEDGQVKFQGFDVSIYRTFLYSMVNFDADIPDSEGRRIVSAAIFKAGKGEITPKSLIREISKLEHEYRKRPIARYVICTSISIDKNQDISRRHFGRSQVIFDRRLPNSFSRAASEISKEANKNLFDDSPDNYMAVRVHVSAISESAAVGKALDLLDLLRGIWNLFENQRHHTRISFGGGNEPVNRIILGPFHTLHFPDGKLASKNRYWYERTYLKPVKPFRIKEFEKMLEYENIVFKKLKACQYQSEMENAIIRYSRALDDRNWDTAFIRLWGILELLTDSVNLQQSKTVSRGSKLFQEIELVRQILTNLKDYRNSSIHVGTENSDVETYLYELKNIVEEHIIFNLWTKAGFENLSQVGRFWDLPINEEALLLREKIMAYALRFRGYL